MNVLTVMENAQRRDELAQEYATMSERYGVVSGLMDTMWLEKRLNLPEATDKYIDKLIGASEIGREFNELKFKMKGYEKRISSLNSIITVANNEARNQW